MFVVQGNRMANKARGVFIFRKDIVLSRAKFKDHIT